MNNLTKRLWLYGYLNKKLEEIETLSRVFSNSEAYFIKAVNILYRIDKPRVKYF